MKAAWSPVRKCCVQQQRWEGTAADSRAHTSPSKGNFNMRAHTHTPLTLLAPSCCCSFPSPHTEVICWCVLRVISHRPGIKLSRWLLGKRCLLVSAWDILRPKGTWFPNPLRPKRGRSVPSPERPVSFGRCSLGRREPQPEGKAQQTHLPTDALRPHANTRAESGQGLRKASLNTVQGVSTGFRGTGCWAASLKSLHTKPEFC